jgi:hypothetical protein
MVLRLLLVLSMGAASSAFARELPCPGSSMNPSVATRSTWTGDFAGRLATCDLCSYVIEIATTPNGGVVGGCHITHFRHRTFFYVSFGGSGSGAVCRRRTLRSRLRTCCVVTLPTVQFDVAHPAASLTGTFTCPTQPEAASFSLTAQ